MSVRDTCCDMDADEATPCWGLFGVTRGTEDGWEGRFTLAVSCRRGGWAVGVNVDFSLFLYLFRNVRVKKRKEEGHLGGSVG